MAGTVAFKDGEYFVELKWFLSCWIIWVDAISVAKDYIKFDFLLLYVSVDKEYEQNVNKWMIIFEFLFSTILYVFYFLKNILISWKCSSIRNIFFNSIFINTERNLGEKMLKIGGGITIHDGNDKTKYIYSKFCEKYGKKYAKYYVKYYSDCWYTMYSINLTS